MRSRITVEHALYAGLFCLALWLRFESVGRAPLSDLEAREALAALNVAGTPVKMVEAFGPTPISPAYASLTALAFLLFGHGTALARTIPALAGALLVVAPYLFRRGLGRTAAVLMGGLIAVSPIFTGGSRTASSGMLAALSLIVTIGSYLAYIRAREDRWLILTATALAVSLLSGPAALTGWLTLGFTLSLAELLRIKPLSPVIVIADRQKGASRSTGLALMAGGLTLFGLATFVSLFPAGLGAAAEQFRHWLLPGSVRPAGLLPLNLWLYEPLVMIFGLVAAGRAIFAGDGLRIRLALWAFVTILFSALYPGRATSDAYWVLLPFAALAAGELQTLMYFPGEQEDRLASVSQVVIALVLFAYSWLSLTAYAEVTRLAGNSANNDALLISLGALALAAIISVMFGLGWSRAVAAQAFRVSVALALAVYGLAAMWSLTRLRPDSPLEPWNDRPASSQLNLLVKTLTDISNRNTGSPDGIEVAVLGDPVSALGWALRDFDNATFLDDLGPRISSPAVITPQTIENPTLGSAYIGESFTLREQFASAIPIPLDWAGWLAYRRGPVTADQVILWVRQDVQLPDSPVP